MGRRRSLILRWALFYSRHILFFAAFYEYDMIIADHAYVIVQRNGAYHSDGALSARYA